MTLFGGSLKRLCDFFKTREIKIMKKTSSFEAHKRQGARFIDFAGWRMPFSYSSPKEEHLAARSHGAIFDVSHMGEIRVRGKDSLPFLESLVPSHVRLLAQRQAQYSVFCNERGGLIDDLIIYAIAPGQDYLLCVNGALKEKDRLWLESHKGSWRDLEIRDESALWGMLAVQGPKSFELLKAVFPSVPFDGIKRFHFVFQEGKIFSRTGYTGEKGFEIYIPWDKTAALWERLLEEGKRFSIIPAGLGARDTLRLEMGYLLSGQDFDETKNPFEAGLAWLLKNPKAYIGKEALLRQREAGWEKQIRGFALRQPSAVPRKGCLALSMEGEAIGIVTSGAKSPTLEKMIGMAYIKRAAKNTGDSRDSFFIDIRGEKAQAYVAPMPFLRKGEPAD